MFIDYLIGDLFSGVPCMPLFWGYPKSSIFIWGAG